MLLSRIVSMVSLQTKIIIIIVKGVIVIYKKVQCFGNHSHANITLWNQNIKTIDVV